MVDVVHEQIDDEQAVSGNFVINLLYNLGPKMLLWLNAVVVIHLGSNSINVSNPLVDYM